MQTPTRMSLDRMRAILDSALCGIITIDQRGIVTSFNASAQRLFGYAEHEIIGWNISLLMPSPYREEHDSYLAAYIETGVAKIIGSGREVQGLRKDGTVFPMILGISEFKDGDGRFFTAVLSDISEQQRAETALHELEEHLAAMTRQTSAGLGQVDLTGRFLLANPKYCEMVGRSLAELRSLRYQDITHSEDQSENEAMFRLCVEMGQDVVFDKRYLRPDGSQIWVRIHASPVRSQTGQITGILATVFDISGIKRSEVVLRESEAFSRAVLNSMSSEIAVLDRVGKIIAVNEAWCRFPHQANDGFEGYDGKAQIGVNYLQVCRDSVGEGSESAKDAYEGILAVLEGRAPSFSVEYPCRFGSELRWFTMNVTPLGYAPGGAVVSHTDITERKQAEEALRDSEERLRLLGDNLPDSAVYQYCHEADGSVRFYYVSSGIERLNGVSVEEVLCDSSVLHRQIPKEYLASLAEAEARSARELSDFDMEVPMHLPDGRVRWMLLHSRPRRFPDGRTLWDGVQTDITKRKQAEDSLRESEERLRLFIEHAPVAIAMFDRDMHYLAVSRRWMTDYQLAGDGIVGRSHYEVFPEIPERWKAVHRLGMQGKITRADEDSFQRLDGRIQWQRWEVRPWHEANGEVGGIVVFTEDISERKHAEQALKVSEERLAFVLEAADIGTWDWEIPADKLYASPRCLALFGLPPNTNWSLEGFMEMLHPEDREPVSRAIAAALEGSDDYQMEMRTIWPDGSLHWVASRGRVYFDAAGRPVRMSGATLDLTENKRVEVQLRERQSEAENYMRLCVANQTIAAVAHELNQPLNAIASYSAGALRLLKSDNPPLDKLALAFEQNAKQSLRAGQVIRELLVLLRGGETITESFDLNQLVRETVIHTKTDSLFGGFKTSLDLAECLPSVQANRIQVEKVLNNLLRNAVEAMRGAGIKAEAVWVMVRTAEQGGLAQVTVGDSGPGLTEDSFQRVFEPFFTTKPRGLGMGLAISRSLIEAQGGELWAERVVGTGAVFHFTLPFAEQGQA